MQHLTLLNAFPTFSYPLHYQQYETSVLACLKTLGLSQIYGLSICNYDSYTCLWYTRIVIS